MTLQENQYIRELENQVHRLTLLNISYLKQIRLLEEKAACLDSRDSLTRHKSGLLFSKNGHEDEGNKGAPVMTRAQKHHLDMIKNSYAFMVGEIIVDGVRRPGFKTLLIPFRITRLLFRYLFKR
jgi:hypothetical protein